MLGRILVLFIVIPFLDLYLLLKIAGVIGVLETVLLVITTGIIGGYLMRSQGIQTLRRLQFRVSQGDMPSKEVADGALIIIGGALLITPGVITDIAGFSLLLPITRPPIRRYLSGKLRRNIDNGGFRVEVHGFDRWDDGDGGIGSRVNDEHGPGSGKSDMGGADSEY